MGGSQRACLENIPRVSNVPLVLVILKLSGLILIPASLSFLDIAIPTNVPNCVIRFNRSSNKTGNEWQQIHKENPLVDTVLLERVESVRK